MAERRQNKAGNRLNLLVNACGGKLLRLKNYSTPLLVRFFVYIGQKIILNQEE